MPLSFQSLLCGLCSTNPTERDAPRRNSTPVIPPPRPLRRTASWGSFIVDPPWVSRRPRLRPFVQLLSAESAAQMFYIRPRRNVATQVADLDPAPAYPPSPNAGRPPTYSPAAPAPASAVEITSAPPSPSWEQLFGEMSDDESVSDVLLGSEILPCEDLSYSDSRSERSFWTTQSMPDFATSTDNDIDDDVVEPVDAPVRGRRQRLRRRIRNLLRFRRR